MSRKKLAPDTIRGGYRFCEKGHAQTKPVKAPPQEKTPLARGSDFRSRRKGLLLAEAAEFLLEARQTPAAIEQMLLAAGPGRVRLRVDVETQRVARLAPGGARGELGSVGHDDLDGVIVGVKIGFHRGFPAGRMRSAKLDTGFASRSHAKSL